MSCYCDLMKTKYEGCGAVIDPAGERSHIKKHNYNDKLIVLSIIIICLDNKSSRHSEKK